MSYHKSNIAMNQGEAFFQEQIALTAFGGAAQGVISKVGSVSLPARATL